MQGGFLEPAKIAFTFQGVLLGGSNSEKSGGHQKKKFLINNAVEALILLKEDYQFLLRLCIPMGKTWVASKRRKNVVQAEFFKFIKTVFILWWGVVGELN